MTNEELQKAIDTIRRAYHNDELQQRRHGLSYECEWHYPDITSNAILDRGVEHRIKPHPREVWITNESLSARPGEAVTAWPAPSKGYKFIKFREVLDD